MHICGYSLQIQCKAILLHRMNLKTGGGGGASDPLAPPLSTSLSNIGFHGIISTPLHWIADTRTAILCKLHVCSTYIHVCVGGWDTNQLTGINSPPTSAWETDSCWYAKVEWRRAPGGYKKKKLATKITSSWHKYQSSNTTKWSARCSSWPSQPS